MRVSGVQAWSVRAEGAQRDEPRALVRAHDPQLLHHLVALGLFQDLDLLDRDKHAGRLVLGLLDRAARAHAQVLRAQGWPRTGVGTGH